MIMIKEHFTFILLISIFALMIVFLIIAYIEKSKNIRTLKQIEQIRSEIFTKITHEFRTPLTTILGLSRQMREMKDLNSSHSHAFLSAIERQGKNLSILVNQLLDISNFQSEIRTIEWKTGNIVSYISMVTESFVILARGKDIDLKFFSKENEIETDFVPDYVSKILNNLVGNAIKYCDPGTKIYVMTERSEKDRKKLIIKVIDNGCGIKKEDLPKIFNLFYRIPEHNDKEGNGVGLTLTKQLVEILGGAIEVDSEIEKGTTFQVTLPIALNEKVLYTHWKPNNEKHENSIVQPVEKSSDMFAETIYENDTRKTILLVEDNKDIALYIRSIFPKESYNIMYCTNGIDALNIATTSKPDIILTDIIMPKKNGIELIKNIKESPLINHIPVVIISAKTRDEDVYEGLKSGAELYIKKPFQPEELKLKVDNLFSSRDIIIEKFTRTVIQEPKNVDVTEDSSTDMEFLRLATDIIYKEMKNPDFTPTLLAKQLAISVSQLNKKLNTITGYPSSNYILQVKLSNAKKLLINDNKTIGEIAADCGIFDLNYFSRVFKKQTGLTPSQFRKLPNYNNARQMSKLN